MELRKIAFYLLSAVVFCSCSGLSHRKAIGPKIDIWYGDRQEFGKIGHPQRWVNVLGNAISPHGLTSLTYSLNGEAEKVLTIGEDGRRLAQAGDFNVDIDRARLRGGDNQLRIVATDSLGRRSVKVVELVYHGTEKKWPLPYVIDWQKVANIQEAAQIVDGDWQLGPGGIRTLDPYYDRVLAFGDSTWRDYEVSTTVVFHSFTPPHEGPPTFGVSHAAIATRWPGHDLDDKQPHVKWHPLGATAEFRLTAGLDSCRWRIFDGQKLYLEDTTRPRRILLGKKYGMKHRVETLVDNSTLFRTKLWPADQPEPAAWDLEAREKPDNVPNGSALLIAHNADVTFGNVWVVAVR
ncbi:hypothetical protein [Persicitalea sp.]|uniref:hypothetical protein n=1 Tax=Persicitalea sp. TaxID=3100273 RepID=UPI0035932456